jgi:mono/diheme cytochrome c family protein
VTMDFRRRRSVCLTRALSMLVGAVSLLLPANASAQDSVTFTKDVAPIFQRSCVQCHRPGAIAPMSLETYQDVRPWARSIRQRVSNFEMPPWGYDKHVGVQKLKNDSSLSERDIETIVKWVDAGSPIGNPADMPPLRKFDDFAWSLSRPPDLVVSMPESYTVKAHGPDQKVDFIADYVMPEDRYIMAVQSKPNVESFKVVHHSNTSIMLEDGTSDFLNEYAIGKGAEEFPANTGRLLPKGSRIQFNVHYHSLGEDVNSRSSVAFWFYPKGEEPKFVVHTQHVGDNVEVDIPPGEITRHDGYFRLPKPTQLIAMQPHTHIRGKRQCLEAIYPDLAGDDNRPEPAKTEMISCIDINFGWMMTYTYAEDAAPLLPAGTVLHLITWHDNTTGNKANPNPKNWIGQGGRTTDEMTYIWMNMTFLDQAEFNRRVQARKAKINVTQNQQQ